MPFEAVTSETVTFATLTHIRELLRSHRGLMVKFALTSIGRMVLSMAAILLVKEFLSGALGDDSSLASTLSAYFGQTVMLWIVAGIFVGTFVGSSLLHYASQILQQHIVKVVELGMMVRIIRQLLRLSVPYFESRSQGDVLQAVRSDAFPPGPALHNL